MDLSDFINPLFLDSTTSIGEKVSTDVELYGLALKKKERIFFEVADQRGLVQRFEMKALHKGKSLVYQAQVWLEYQLPLKYRFLVLKRDEVQSVTLPRLTFAGHVISDQWAPSSDKESCEFKWERLALPWDKKSTQRNQESQTNGPVRLMEEESLNEIKSLLEDLF